MKKKIGIIGFKGLPPSNGVAAAGDCILDKMKDKYDFTVYSIKPHTPEDSGYYNGYRQIVFDKFPVAKFNTLYYYLKSMTHALMYEKFDIVHLHNLDGAFILPLLKLKFKLVATGHGRPQGNGKWNKVVELLFDLIENLFIRIPNVVTSVAKTYQKFYMEKFNKNVLYIPNGVYKDIKHKPVDDKDYVLFAAGRVIPCKGCHLLMNALQKIKYKEQLLFIGDRTHKPAYTEEIDKLAQGLNVKYIDLIRDKELLMGYLHSAKLFVFPSLQEAMSMMLLEASSMKVPIIASDIEENKAIFDDTEVLYFESGNDDDLAEKIQYALNNPEIMQKMSEKAYKKVIDEFIWDGIAQKYADIYDSL